MRTGADLDAVDHRLLGHIDDVDPAAGDDGDVHPLAVGRDRHVVGRTVKRRAPDDRPLDRIDRHDLAHACGPPVVAPHDPAEIEHAAAGRGHDVLGGEPDQDRPGYRERGAVDDRYVAALGVLHEYLVPRLGSQRRGQEGEGESSADHGAFHPGTPGSTGRTSASATPRRIDGTPCTYTTSPSIGEVTSPVLLPRKSVV